MNKGSAIRHLRKDARTWADIEQTARREKMRDLREIREMKR